MDGCGVGTEERWKRKGEGKGKSREEGLRRAIEGD